MDVPKIRAQAASSWKTTPNVRPNSVYKPAGRVCHMHISHELWATIGI